MNDQDQALPASDRSRIERGIKHLQDAGLMHGFNLPTRPEIDSLIRQQEELLAESIAKLAWTAKFYRNTTFVLIAVIVAMVIT